MFLKKTEKGGAGMNERQSIYDELCGVLTDYEGKGSEEGASAEDLYEMLIKIQKVGRIS